MLGADLAEGTLAVARLHAVESGVDVQYRQISAEALAAEAPGAFDVVACLEMIEHVPDPQSIVSACATLVKPGGHVFFSTINRNPKAWALAVVGAEYLLNLVPRGTHDYRKFIRPSELARAVRDAGLDTREIIGMTYNPLTRKAALGADVDVNYFLHATKPEADLMYAELEAARANWRYQPPVDLLAGRTMLVTGAGDGIGRCAARTFAAYRANVVLLGRNQQKLEAVFDAIKAETDTDPTIVPCDLEVADARGLHGAERADHRPLRSLDGLLHNASMLGPRVPIEFYDAASWRRVMQVNVEAMFLLTQGVLPALRRSADASVVITSSSVGRAGRAYWGAYAASKFAAEGFAQVLADELADEGRVRVTTLNPGATRTTMRTTAYPGEDPMTVPPPEARMDIYLFLMGPQARGRSEIQWDARDWTP